MPPEQLQQNRTASEDLWKQVGLQELRHSLDRVRVLADHFEQLLGTLPPCQGCARATLLQEIRTAGGQLGSKIISLTVLAETMREALVTAQQADAELAANAPGPCRCPGEVCTCHS